jgi:hypothetical protein
MGLSIMFKPHNLQSQAAKSNHWGHVSKFRLLVWDCIVYDKLRCSIVNYTITKIWNKKMLMHFMIINVSSGEIRRSIPYSNFLPTIVFE